MDIVVIFIILLIVALLLKRFDSVVIFLGIIDVFLRIIDYIGKNTIDSVNNIINQIFPDSIPAIINKYVTGTVASIVMWLYVIIMILFVYYVLKIIIHKK